MQAIEKAEDEMLKNGIVAVGDICNNALTLPQKQKERLFITILLKQVVGCLLFLK